MQKLHLDLQPPYLYRSFLSKYHVLDAEYITNTGRESAINSHPNPREMNKKN